MSIFQWIATFFAAAMVYLVNIHRRKLSLSQGEVFFWYALWFSFFVLALFPNTLLGLVQVLRFSRVFDLLTVMAMMVLTAIVFISYFKQKESSKRLEDFVRQDAITKVRAPQKPLTADKH